MITDRTIISTECWSQYPLNKRIWHYGQYITGDKFKVHPKDVESLKKIVSILEANANSPNIQKCLVIFGKPGSGKSMLTRIIHKVTYPTGHIRRYKFASAQNICNEFNEFGHKALDKYTNGNWIFDDLGREDKTGIGNSYRTYNVMDRVIDEIHKNVHRGTASFIISTNDTKEILSTKYSPQVMSRLNQICEFVTINSTDYRINKDIITFYPEVLWPLKSSKQLELTEQDIEAGKRKKEEILTELVQKFGATVHEKRDIRKRLKETSFEEAIDQWFSDQWLKQGNPLRESNNEAVIVYEEKEYNRNEFTEHCRTLIPEEG